MATGTVNVAAADNPGVIVLPPFLYLGVFVAALVANWLVPLPMLTTLVALTLGLCLSVVAIVIARWGRRTMTEAGTNVRPTQPATTIVTSGPFRFSRNPLYVSLTLLYLGLTTAVNTLVGSHPARTAAARHARRRRAARGAVSRPEVWRELSRLPIESTPLRVIVC